MAERERSKLKNIFNNWINNEVDYEIAFVDYEKMWDELPCIVDFLNLDREAIDTFSSFKKRKSERILTQNKELNNHLQYIYQGFKEFVESKMDDNE